jgi:glycosyltransferase involved in cell wall biosynthesis
MTLPCNPISWEMWRNASATTQGFDVVHAAAFPYAWPIICARRLARRLNVPFAVTPFVHGGDPDDCRDETRRGYTSPALLSLLHSADAIFVQTPSEREILINRGIQPSRLILQGMGVAPGECLGGDRDRARRQWGARADEMVVGHLANLSPQKGSLDLLLAAEKAWSNKESMRLVLAGPEMPSFSRFFSNFPASRPVVRLGTLSDSEKKDFFAGIDVFALPSRSDSFGLVLLEAWANRVPSIAYRAGGLADIIRNDSDGLLIRCGDVQGLAVGLVALIHNRRWRQQMGSAGHARLASEFRWEPKLNLVLEVYKKLTRPGNARDSQALSGPNWPQFISRVRA